MAIAVPCVKAAMAGKAEGVDATAGEETRHMMKTRGNPYTSLKTRCAEWAASVLRPQTQEMFVYGAKDVVGGATWALSDLAQRVRAADQLGHDVMVTWEEKGLVMTYRKRPDDMSWEIRP